MESADPGGSGSFGDIAAVLLTGGASTRMGRDKAHIEFDGEPAAVRLAKMLVGFFGEVLVVGGDPPAAAPGRRVSDGEGPQSALRGLVSGLGAATRDRVLVVATDLPFLTADLVLALVACPEADAVVPRVDGRLHPLCALYRREPVLAAARARLEAGQLALHGLLDAVDTRVLSEEAIRQVDPEGMALVNVNTPEELARAVAGQRGEP